MSTTFDSQMDDQVKLTIQTLKDMLSSCKVEFNENCDKHLPLVEFSHHNSFHSSNFMASYENLYGRRYRSPIILFEVGETSLFLPDLVYKSFEKVRIIKN